MFQSIADQWALLGERDRRALSVLIPIVILLLLWFGLIAPLQQRHTLAQSQLNAAQNTFQEVVAKAPQLVGQPNTAVAGSTNLNTDLRRHANRLGISIVGLEPDGDLLRVRIDEARYSQLVRWLAVLEQEGILADQVTLEARNRPGLVSARVAFRR
ncbi:MAG: type II secretion system protein M [Saccharospirillum sp.]|nr:type II secretion system protein M [Saccharospirillum sp.]